MQSLVGCIVRRADGLALPVAGTAAARLVAEIAPVGATTPVTAMSPATRRPMATRAAPAACLKPALVP
jgi:hypothetical protein